jgi:transposase
MSRPRRKLDEQGEAGTVLRLLKKEPGGWRRERLQAVKLGLEGELGLEEIAEAIGRGRSRIQDWFDAFRRGGVEELLKVRRGKGPKSLLNERMAAEMKRELAKGQWRRAADAHHWLTERFGLKVGLGAVYKYLGKCAARLKVPRPSHEKKNAEAAETFKAELAAKLEALDIEPGKPVRIWVVDEMRYGLQPVTRRVWALRGERVVVPVNPAYEWGYVYGALQVGAGGAEFFYCPTVNLECSGLFLEQISRRDPGAVHVILWDGAGFHSGQAKVPENVRLLPLPAYSPELNPVEKLWDIVKDGICNRACKTLEELEAAITAVLKGYWKDACKVFSLIGRGWLLDQANAISPDVLLV